MDSTLHTFMDAFSARFPIDEENTVQLSKIIIPIIQRDYAQGRQDPEVKRVRKRFLDSLHKAITESNMTLDFVYGDIDKDGIMTPLDGQQRLTTLFLLHFYAAKKENICKEDYAFLNNFSYETRYSARDFCNYLVNCYEPSFECHLSDEIEDQAWFPLDWKKDPTISSMLTMLDAIDETFSNTTNIWNRLKEGAITFYFLAIKDMGLTDELYIKMNSRGKPLTQFEHFKAELEHGLREIDESLSIRIMDKIDKDWTDMLWQYKGDDHIIDDEFLRYFHFICDILCYKSGGTTQGKHFDEFDLLKQYFSKDAANVRDNILLFENYFDCWCNLGSQTPSSFLSDFISTHHENNKIILTNKIDIFEDCLRNNGEIAGNGNRQFPLNRIVLLFGIITYLLNQNTISRADFSRRLRVLNNLIQNSEDEISDSEYRTSGNRMPAILKQVEALILNGTIDFSIEKSLNNYQLQEESEKIAWVAANPQYAESLYALEDHPLLQGQISIVGLDHPENFSRFADLFKCDKDLIDCALMRFGNYAQREKGIRYALGSKNPSDESWKTLFHNSVNKDGFDETKRILSEILNDTPPITDTQLHAYTDSYITQCEANSVFDIRYYYIKYRLFRPGAYGKYAWSDLTNKPYEVSVMLTPRKLSESTYQPFLKAIDADHLSREHLGQRIVIGSNYIVCENAAYIVKSEDNTVLHTIQIAQNEMGIDTEDRIEKFRNWYNANKEQLSEVQ